MAYPPKTQVESIDQPDDDDAGGPAKVAPKGPPPARPRPRSASDSSLYTTAGKSATAEGNSGLGAEGSNPSIIGIQGLSLVQRGLQMLNLAFPDNPGLVATVSDITVRLQTMIPQLVGQAQNGMGPGANPNMGMLQQMMQGGGGMGMPGGQQPPAPGMPGMPMPPQQGMGGPAGGGHMGPPVPPMQQPPVR